jgi:hypothetical protein
VAPAGGTTGGQNVVHPTVAGGTGAAHADNPGVVRSRSKLYTAKPLIAARPVCEPRVAVEKAACGSAGGAVGATVAGAARGDMEVLFEPPLHAEKTASATTDKAAGNVIAR